MAVAAGTRDFFGILAPPQAHSKPTMMIAASEGAPTHFHSAGSDPLLTEDRFRPGVESSRGKVQSWKTYTYIYRT